MSFNISNEHIKNQLYKNTFANAMNLTSFFEDGIVFSNGVDLPNNIFKNQWMKYCDIIMPYSGYDIQYSHPYKSDKHKQITEYEIINKDGSVVGEGTTHCLENAKAQAFIKISGLSSFSKIVSDKLDRLKFIMDDDIRFEIKKSEYRYYHCARDLNKIINDKYLLRRFKFSLLDI